MATKSLDTVEWAFDDSSGIAHIVLNRPDSLNALSSQLRDDIVAAFHECERVDEAADGVTVRAVVVEGSGEKAFSAGADINDFEGSRPGLFEPSPIYDVPEAFGAPVIAKIDGYCLGGGFELALACDILVASERSTVGFPEVTLGLIPGGGGTQRLARLVGTSRAKELTMTGARLSAREAAEEGILTHVVPAAELDDEVDELAHRLADQAPLAVRSLKDVINKSQEMGLREGWHYEHRVIKLLHETADAAEGRAAFAEDREPRWQGK